MLFVDPFVRIEPLGRRTLRFALILAAHLALLWGALDLAARPEVRQAAQEVLVRLIDPPQPQPEVKPPEPPRSKPTPARQAPPMAPPPILTAAAVASAPVASFTVAPQPPAPPALPPIDAVPAPPAPAAPPAAPPAVIAARFDADYLSNPKPVYPVASRRLGEEGKVVLRVHVSAEGTARTVEVKQSCGFSRLDEAAKAAVEQWRFVPARRGADAIDSWVSVPIVFSLQSA
jgi:periplasmic protein TonB